MFTIISRCRTVQFLKVLEEIRAPWFILHFPLFPRTVPLWAVFHQVFLPLPFPFHSSHLNKLAKSAIWLKKLATETPLRRYATRFAIMWIYEYNALLFPPGRLFRKLWQQLKKYNQYVAVSKNEINFDLNWIIQQLFTLPFSFHCIRFSQRLYQSRRIFLQLCFQCNV